MGGDPRSWQDRLAAGWRALALLCLNTVVAFLLVNLAAVAALSFYQRPPGALQYGLEKLARVYPGWSGKDIEALLRETWSREYVYSPFVQHREGVTRGRFVNVDRHGFRHSANQAPWPPAVESFSIFVFGGSTTFGYGVADDETIPSHLQRALAGSCWGAPQVYNFGRGNYYGEQERVLFEALLAEGRSPDVALFIDGLNEWKLAPKYTTRLDYLLRESDGRLVLRALKTLPVVELLRRLRGEASNAGGSAEGEEPARQLAELALARWLRGKRLIEAAAAEFGIVPLFVWQPVPTWGYPLEHHLFAVESGASLARHGALRQGYALMDRRRTTAPELEPAGNFLWLADLQRGRAEPLYVDAVHYTAAFSEDIARRIADFIYSALPCEDAGG